MFLFTKILEPSFSIVKYSGTVAGNSHKALK